jgi:hypothetical protein
VTRQRLRRATGQDHALLLRHPLEQVDHLVGGDPSKIEPLASAHDGLRHLVRLGGGQHEPHAGRRLLEHLEQRVERLAGEPLGLVDDVDLLPSHRRGGGCTLAKVAGIVDAAVRRGVDLHDIEVPPFPDRHALRTGPARLGGGAAFAVDHLGQDPGRGGLAGPPRPAEQERMRQPVLAHRAYQRSHHVVLAHHVVR